MRYVIKIIWLIYGVTITGIHVDMTRLFFTPRSHVQFYYYFLRTFDPGYTIIWSLHAVSIVILWTQIVSLWLFINKTSWGQQWIWQALFILRIFLDIIGRQYENQLLASYYQSEFSVFVIVAAAGMMINIPWYLATWHYAFRKGSSRFYS
jgi:hypothetical protein